MASHLCYRVESPASASRYVAGRGIWSAACIKAYNEGTLVRYSDVQVDPLNPELLEPKSQLAMHLLGKQFPSPFVSATRDIYRALSLASRDLTLAWDPDEIYLAVIDEDLLYRPPLEVLRYLNNVPAINSARITRWGYMVNSVNLNNEVICRRRIPERAIISRVPLSSVFPGLPDWLKEPGSDSLLLYVPPQQKSKIRAWYRKVIRRRQQLDPNRSRPATECRDMAEMILGADGQDYIDFICALLARGPQPEAYP